MTKLRMMCLLVLLVAAAGLTVSGQKIETIDGVRVVHNQGKGKWGKSPRIRLEKVRTLGDIETMDETVAFYMPMDIALDASGNLYVLDTGNHRIQKFSPQGSYIATIGRKGQGPGEFVYPYSLAVDTDGGLIVTSPYSNRIQFLEKNGKEVRSLAVNEQITRYIRFFGPQYLLMASERRTPIPGEEDHQNGLEPLLQVIDREGKFIRTIGKPKDFDHGLINTKANDIAFHIGSNQDIYVTFTNLNRVEKYSPEGAILWRADRKLDYKSDKPLDKGRIESSKNNISIQSPKMNRCSEAISSDDHGRVWVITLDRQLKEEETAHTSVSISHSDGNSTVTMATRSEGEVYATDAFRLDVFDPEGVLLGQFPLDHFADIILISGDRLFILDKLRRMQVIEYRIHAIN